MQPLPEGISVQTLALSDLVDSTRLVRELGDARAAEVMARIDRVCRDALVAGNGIEIDKSDGFLMLFNRPLDGARWALAVHRDLAGLAEELSLPIALRVGLHVGEVYLRRNRQDDVARGAKPLEVEGLAKPLAARVMSLAAGGQTLLTRAAFELARRASTDPTLRWTRHGAYRVKGMDTPLEVCELGGEGQEPQKPTAAEKAGPANLAVTNLSTPLTTFVGRQEEQHRVAAMLDRPDCRLLTLLGPGGTGKTRLATELGLELASRRSGGVWFCDLATTTERAQVIQAIGDALGVALGDTSDQDGSLDQLAAAMEGRGETLLILDNFEQIHHLADTVVGTLLARSRTAQLLVTSRTRLGLEGEHVVELGPLAPDEALALFDKRALRVRPDFTLEDNRAVVGRICERLDRMPLAIELCAARVRTLAPARIEDRLSDRFRVLRSRGTGRQSTMRSTIDWSWGLLTPAERSTLAQLSAFRGGFFLDDAEAVVDLSDIDEAEWTEDVVESLRDKSLLRAWVPEGLPTELRLDMYESVREYASEKLVAMGKEQATWRQHARHYGRPWRWPREIEERAPFARRQRLDLGNMTVAVERFSSTEVQLALDPAISAHRIHADSRNAAASCRVLHRILPALHTLEPEQRFRFVRERVRWPWTVTEISMSAALEEGASLAEELGDTDFRIGCEVALIAARAEREGDLEASYRALRDRLDSVLSSLSPSTGVWALSEAAMLARRLGRAEDAVQYGRLALRMQQEHQGLASSTLAMSNLALTELDNGNFDEGVRLLEESARVAGQLSAGEATYELALLGTARLAQGRPEEAIALYERTIPHHRRSGHVPLATIDGGNLGLALHMLGQLDQARSHLETTLAWVEKKSWNWPAAHFRAPLCAVLADLGRVDEATRLLDAQRSALTTLGDPRLSVLTHLCEGHLLLARGDTAGARERAEADAPSVDIAIARRTLRATLDRRSDA